MEKEDVIEKYDQLLVRLCMNECFDLKSVITGEYKYTYEEVESIVLQFNEKYNVAILIKDICKELQFTYGIDMDISRAARVQTSQV